MVDLEKYQHILPARILLTMSIAIYQLVLITSSDRLEVLGSCAKNRLRCVRINREKLAT